MFNGRVTINASHAGIGVCNECHFDARVPPVHCPACDHPFRGNRICRTVGAAYGQASFTVVQNVATGMGRHLPVCLIGLRSQERIAMLDTGDIKAYRWEVFPYVAYTSHQGYRSLCYCVSREVADEVFEAMVRGMTTRPFMVLLSETGVKDYIRTERVE